MTKHGKHEDRGPIAARRRWYFTPEEEKPPSRWRRKVLGLPVAGWLIGALGTGIAIALIVFSLGMSGTFTFTVAEDVQVEYLSAATDNSTLCTYSVTPSTLTIDTWSDVGAGATCDGAVSFTNTGNTTVYLADFVSNDPLVTIAEGWGGTAVPGTCHMEIPVGGAATGFFPWTITVDSPTLAGDYTIDMSQVTFVFADNNTEGDCDSSTA